MFIQNASFIENNGYSNLGNANSVCAYHKGDVFLLNIDWHHKKTPLEAQESKGVGG